MISPHVSMLRAEGLRHTFGSVRALDGISFSLSAGQTLVLFGPNGSGKTTLLRVLAGLIRPLEGHAEVAGGRRAVGWIGHQSHLYGHLTVRENLLFRAALYDVPAAQRATRAEQLLRRLGVADRADVPVRVLSRGLTQRVTIARALMHDPSVLLLDEPFTGLDLAAAGQFRALLAELTGAGRIAVLATHNVDEGVELATDVAFQARGRFVHFAPRGTRGAGEIAAAYRKAVGGD
jgi:heme exporter protein A